MDFDYDKAAANPWLASAVGSAISLKFMPGPTWGERALNAVITYGSGVVLGGAIVDRIGGLTGKSAAGVVLLTSALCLVVFRIVIEAAQRSEWGEMIVERGRKFIGLDPKKED